MFNKQVFNIVGLSWIFLGLSMILSTSWSFYYSENDSTPILISSGITIFFGLLLFFISKSQKNKELTPRDGFAIVSIGWITMAAFSALPLYLSNYYFPNYHISYLNCYFEAMSGLTTTGASILGHSSTIEIEGLTHGLLFWRSFTQFIGGMGIIVFSLAILPMVGIGGVQLFRAEVAGPIADKLTPRVRNTAKLLWQIYLGLILIEIIALKLAGMSFFDSICHSFGTMATGGFSTKNASILYYQSSLIEWIIIIFMFLAATNFSLHFLCFFKKKIEYFKDKEFRVYYILILAVSLFFILSSSIFNFESIKNSIFTSISLITTTGFVNSDFGEWSSFSKVLIFFLFFIGGCAGSTTGGMKLVRTILVSKYLFTEVRKLLHPKGVFPIKIGDNTISDEVVKNTLGFYLFYIFIFVFASMIFSSTGLDLITSLSASASSIGNIGPGLGSIGPMNNWGHLTILAKGTACFCMLLGRLEIFTVIVLFSKSFWIK